MNTGKKCQDLPPYPLEVEGAIGETVNGYPLICGGVSNALYYEACYQLKNNNWSKIGDMKLPRWGASSVLLENNTLLVFGGYAGMNMRRTESIEFDSNGAIVQQWYGPYLPNQMYSNWHCSIQYAPTKVILIGGRFAYWTAIYDLEIGMPMWTDGPILKDGVRYHFACGQIKDKLTSEQ